MKKLLLLLTVFPSLYAVRGLDEPAQSGEYTLTEEVRITDKKEIEEILPILLARYFKSSTKITVDCNKCTLTLRDIYHYTKEDHEDTPK